MPLNLLNYLWVKPYLDHTSDLSGIDVVLPPVPLAYQQNIVDTVGINPNWRVNLWMEPDERPFKAKYLPSIFTSCGVVIRFLDEIPAYRTDTYLNLSKIDRASFLKTDHQFWRWIDIIKILILKHTLNGADRTFFADMDIAGLVLDSPEIMRPLTDHSLVVGVDSTKFTPEEWKALERRLFENQMIGFSRKGKFYLRDLYDQTRNGTSDELHGDGYSNGFWPLNNWIKGLANTYVDPRRFEEEIAYYTRYIEV